MPHVVLPSIVKESIDLQTLHVATSLTYVIIQQGSQLGGFPSPMAPRPSSDVALGSLHHVKAPSSSPMEPWSSQPTTTPSTSSAPPISSSLVSHVPLVSPKPPMSSSLVPPASSSCASLQSLGPN